MINFFMKTTNFPDLEAKIGYKFENKELICQAFTRKSYTEEDRFALNNEVLEFYGDKALDFIIVKKMSEYYGSINERNLFHSSLDEGELTEIKKKLVCRGMLSRKIRDLNFQDKLILGRSDYKSKVWEEESVQEDLFEAIIGAVAIDSNWNVDKLTKVVDRMLNPEFYFKNGFDAEIDYVKLIQQWYQKKHNRIPVYKFIDRISSQEVLRKFKPGDKFECNLAIYPYPLFKASGGTKSDARMAAAKEAYEYIERQNLLISLVDEVGVPDFERSVNQLQELHQKGHIGEVEYSFKEEYDANGNPIWRCKCHVGGLELVFSEADSSKKQAKKKVAYEVVKLFLKWEDQYENEA